MRTMLKSVRRKFGIAAPRVTVRTHVPWYLRWLGITAAGVVIAFIGWATYDFGMEFAGFRQSEADKAMKALADTIRKQDADLADLRSRVAAAERQLQIERATYGDLAKQVKGLSLENSTLKEDLAFFQSLIPAAGAEGALTVNRLMVQPEAMPGEFRFRLMLVQAGQRAREFNGRLQLVVNVQEGGRKFALSLPPESEKGGKNYQLSFKSFQRVEGVFKVGPGAVVKSVQVRVFENGANAPKLTQTITVS
jgi:hypothetical protein